MQKQTHNPDYFLNDSLFRMIGIPVVAVLAAYIFYRDACATYHVSMLTAFVVSLTITILIWESNRKVMLQVRKRYPDVINTGKRILLSLLCFAVVTSFISFGTSYLLNKLNIWHHQVSTDVIIHDYVMDMVFVIMVGGTYEAIYFFRKWKASFLEAQELKKENLQSQLDALKNQVNPHFLFNSLNTLSSLIEEDKYKALVFVDELSRVYRYLLQNNECKLTSLENEMQFAKAYFFLLQTRFGDGVKLEVDIDSSHFVNSIPPLTLQILLENAVKHNQVSVSKPLCIKVYTDEKNNLCVMNNLQKKIQKVPSGKMGLANISAKYKLLNQPDVLIQETRDQFTVILPLIAN